MLTRLSLFAWLVSLEAIDAAPERQAALNFGRDLVGLAIGDALVASDGHDELSRVLAELEADGWIAWDWSHQLGVLTPEQPSPSVFDYQAIQRVRNVRITPEGYAAFAAREALGGDRAVEGAPAADPERTQGHPYDLFVCHASEDKEAVARPLARALESRGFSVWFDEEQLQVGARLRMSVEAGLASSRYGVVVLSRGFFEKRWPQDELNGLFAREMADGEDVILPLWHEIDAAFLASKAPMIADRFALKTSGGIENVAERLARRLRRERGLHQLRARALQAPAPPISRTPNVTPITPTLTRDTTALEARERVVAMLRAGDDVGLRELLRFERRTFEDSVLSTLQRAGDDLGSSADPEVLKPVEIALWAHVDRRLGSLLPLIEHRPGELDAELTALRMLAGRTAPTRSPFSAWLDGPRWPVWLTTLILGSVAIAFDRFEVVLAMWAQRAAHDDWRPLPVMRLGGAADLGAALLRARPANASRAIELWYPAFAVSDSELLITHYPEVIRGGDTTDSALGFLSRAGDFLWLCGALAGRDKIEVIRFWSSSQVHPTLRARLEHDLRLVESLATKLQVVADDLLATLDDWILTVPGWDI
jgi:hypothetical protein